MRASGVQQQVAPGMDGQGTGYRLEEGLIYRTNQREIGQRSYYTTNDSIGYNCSKEVAEIFAPRTIRLVNVIAGHKLQFVTRLNRYVLTLNVYIPVRGRDGYTGKGTQLYIAKGRHNRYITIRGRCRNTVHTPRVAQFNTSGNGIVLTKVQIRTKAGAYQRS